MTVQQAFDLALQHHQSGRLAEAEALYGQILAVQPDHSEAWHHLGVIAHQNGREDRALELIQKALVLAPNNSAAHLNLGEVYRKLGRWDEAIAAYRRALDLTPDLAQGHLNLGNALRERGQLDEAIAVCRRAVELRPGSPEAHNNLGNALKDAGQSDDAVAAYRRALQLKPDYPEACNNLGVALADRGLLDEAIATYRQALAFRPNYADAHNNLGNALKNRDQIDEAVVAYRRALQLNPENAAYYYNLGNALRDLSELDQAIAAYGRALQLKPDYADAHSNLGSALKDQGRLNEAIAAFRRALQFKPEHAGLRSNLILPLHFHPDCDERTIAEEQQRWNRSAGGTMNRMAQPHANNRRPERRLLVGYVSPDLRDHVVGRNLWPLFRFHDHRSFEVVCYSGVARPDHLTEEFRRCAEHWRNTADLPDAVLAEMIRQDGVDILVDLSQHTAGNRLPVFARRPAPVQVSFAGYPASTGVEGIEYRVSDRYLEAGASEMGDRSSEIGSARPSDLPSSISHLRPAERVYLIESFWCYDPYGMEVVVNGLPAEQSRRITFGGLNNFCKVNDEVLKLWARVLKRVPDSRLVLLTGFGSHRQRTVNFLAEGGIEAHRVEFVPPCPRREYLERYHSVDIALDPFPYGGHTTSLDALWMGVPVVSLAGERAVSRAGLSILNNLSLSELVAFSEDEYVKTAADLAGDVPRLGELRRTLRSRMEASVLMDGPRFARNIEAAYRAMWRRWCGEISLADAEN